MVEDVSSRLKEHYRNTFLKFGANSKGVDWGKEEDVLLRHKLMLDVVRHDYAVPLNNDNVTLLDVGCGYGAFYQYLLKENVRLSYTGIDVVEEMVKYASREFSEATFIHGNFMETEGLTFDYVVCNGILTQKLATTIKDMDQFANNLIRKMFAVANKGIAFNVMSNKVNFMVENLYYRSPVELLAFCLNELSSKVRLEHSYPLFEYTVYLYKEKQK